MWDTLTKRKLISRIFLCLFLSRSCDELGYPKLYHMKIWKRKSGKSKFSLKFRFSPIASFAVFGLIILYILFFSAWQLKQRLTNLFPRIATFVFMETRNRRNVKMQSLLIGFVCKYSREVWSILNELKWYFWNYATL